MYFRIRYSDNCQTVFFKKSGSFFIILFSILGIMPRTVKLYNEPCLCTVKICDILTENLLTRKSDRICAQKIIPKVFFSLIIFFRSIFAVGTISLLCFLCITIPPSRFACHLPLHKGGLRRYAILFWQIEFCYVNLFNKKYGR